MIGFIQGPTVVKAYAAGSTSTSFIFSSNFVKEGDLLVAHSSDGNDQTASTNTLVNSAAASWTKMGTPYNGRIVWYKIATAADLDTTHTYTGAGTSNGLITMVLRNAELVATHTGILPGTTTSQSAISRPSTAIKISVTPGSVGNFPNVINTDTTNRIEWKTFAANTTIATYSSVVNSWHSGNNPTYYAHIVARDTEPTVSKTAPADYLLDPRISHNVTWNYSDVASAAQTQWEVSYRLTDNHNGLDPYVVLGSGSGTQTSYTIPANTLPEDKAVKLRIRAYNGIGWGSAEATHFVSSWTEELWVETSDPYGYLTTGTWEPLSDYEVQVFTGDVDGYGPPSDPVLAPGVTVIPGSDGGQVSVSESASIFVTLSAQDTRALVCTDTRILTASSLGNESTALIVSDTSSVNRTNFVAASESNSITASDSSSLFINAFKTASENVSISSSESYSMFAGVVILATDSGSLLVSENKSNSSTGTASQSFGLSFSESVSISAVFSTSDSASLSTSEADNRFITKPSSDSGSVAISEASAIAVLTFKSATESRSLSVSEISTKQTTDNRAGNEAIVVSVSESSIVETKYPQLEYSTGTIANDRPIGLWTLEGSPAFADYSGHSLSISASNTSRGPALATGVENSTVFSNASSTEIDLPVFRAGQQDRPFSLEVTVLPISGSAGEQKLVSHTAAYDGLLIEGSKISFVTSYSDGDVEISYDSGLLMSMHIVATHTAQKNSLYVNGELVAETEILSTGSFDIDGTLSVGTSASAQKFAANNLAIYDYALSPLQVVRHYDATFFAPVADTHIASTKGESVGVSLADSETFMKTWASDLDWSAGYLVDISASNNMIRPMSIDDTSLPASWTGVFEIDSLPYGTINSISLSWDAIGATVEASLDGASWGPVVKNESLGIIPPGFDITDQLLHIRVSFAGNILLDESYMSNLVAVAVSTDQTQPLNTRPVVVTGNRMRNYEAIEFRDDWGVDLSGGGQIDVGADTSATPKTPRTLEIWYKPKGGTLSTTFPTATTYTNGGIVAPGANEWRLVHIVSAAPVSGSFTISGDIQVGSVTLHEAAFGSGEAMATYLEYSGNPVEVVVSDTTINISEMSEETAVYTYEWSITGAG